MSIIQIKPVWLNRKSQTASTLTWVVAFLLIFFILAMFILFASGLAAPKKIESLVKGVMASDVSTQKYQSFFTNAYILNNLDMKIDYNSEKVSLRQMLEGYSLKKYSNFELVKFIQLLNKATFMNDGFIYSTFSIDDRLIYSYGEDSCVKTGKGTVFLSLKGTLFKIGVTGSICDSYNSEWVGGELDDGFVG
jgi:hypothetical protein